MLDSNRLLSQVNKSLLADQLAGLDMQNDGEGVKATMSLRVPAPSRRSVRLTSRRFNTSLVRHISAPSHATQHHQIALHSTHSYPKSYPLHTLFAVVAALCRVTTHSAQFPVVTCEHYFLY
jgi:hypothetical protein